MYTKLEKSHATFASMRKEFGVVTVRNAKIFEAEDYTLFEAKTAYEIAAVADKISKPDATSNKDTVLKIKYLGPHEQRMKKTKF